ncbi:MAG: glycosyltransferase [Prevotella sp.]|nr:glycosyltransferase [Prevotella sp.]
MKTNPAPAFTVIIPHRNTPSLLARCLASIPRRDDVEILVADDCSEPAFADGVSRVVAACPNARLIALKEHRGGGYARNVALRQAKGEWLVFADADDYFTPAMAEVMERYAQDEEGADLVVMNAIFVDEDGITAPTPLTRHIIRYLRRRSRLSLDVLLYGTWTPWSRMVRREIVLKNDVRFDETLVGNDAMFVLQASSFARKAEVERKVCYHYYQPHEGSQTRAFYNPETFLSRLELRLRINRFYRSAGYPFLWPVRRMMRVAPPSIARPCRPALEAIPPFAADRVPRAFLPTGR